MNQLKSQGISISWLQNNAIAVLAVTLVGVFLLPVASAQDLIIGSNSSGQITNFTSGTNSYSNTYIGYNAGDSNNVLTVANPGTLLYNSVQLVISNGPNNTMVISNGGQVIDTFGLLFGDSSNTSVLVTGAGSLWTSSNSMEVGAYRLKHDNHLVIENEGSVVDAVGDIGGPGSNNSVLITDAGSTWTNYLALYVGYNGLSNSLVISNGAHVVDANSSIGGISTSYFITTNNNVLVTGLGSQWITTNTLSVGDGGDGNSLVISNGGTVIASNSIIGTTNMGTNNLVLVTGTGSLFSNTTTLSIGDGGNSNSLVISNGGTVVDSNATISSGTNSSNSAVVTGSGSLWSNRGSLSVGSLGNGTLTVANGGTVQASSSLIIASNSGSVGVLNIGSLGGNDTEGTIIAPSITFGSGTGSINFNQSDSMVFTNTISGSGSVNQLGSGTTILSASNTYTGTTTVQGGTLAVTGSLTNSLLIVGTNGKSGNFLVSNGGTVVDTAGYIGATNTDSNNSVLVTGAGSIWSNTSSLYVGYGGSSNSLVISNGGSITGRLSFSVIGFATNASNNSVLVTGAGSTWNYGGRQGLQVGYNGSGNSLVISNGGSVIAGTSASIGFGTVSSNNSALVTGSGSTWSNTALFLGYSGSGTLTVANAGTVYGNITIAYSAGSAGILNIGSLGGSDTAGSIVASTITVKTNGTINFNQIDSTTMTSSISGAGSVNQLGTGTTILTGNNTYTGPTTVNAGVLLINNSSGWGVGGSLNVNSNGTFGGYGSIHGNAIINGILAPSIGSTNTSNSLTFVNLALGSNAITQLNIFDTNQNDNIILGLSITNGGLLDISLENTNVLGTYQLFSTYAGGTNLDTFGSFNSVEMTGLYGSLFLTNNSGTWDYDDSINSYEFSQATGQLIVSAVPEPSDLVFFGGIISTAILLVRQRGRSLVSSSFERKG